MNFSLLQFFLLISPDMSFPSLRLWTTATKTHEYSGFHAVLHKTGNQGHSRRHYKDINIMLHLSIWSTILPYLVVVEGREDVVGHFLVEHRCERAWHGGDQPDPVSWATSTETDLGLHVLHEWFGSWVMIYDGYFIFLWKQRSRLRNMNDPRRAFKLH